MKKKINYSKIKGYEEVIAAYIFGDIICLNCYRKIPNWDFLHKNKKGCKWCCK